MRTQLRFIIGLLIGIIGCLQIESAARADAAQEPVDCMNDPACVEIVKSARRLSDANQLHAALTSYESAYQRWQSPWLLINIGRIQQKLGHPAEAITTYRRYLDHSTGDTPERIGAARSYLEQAEKDLLEKRAREAQATRMAAEERPVYKKWWFWVAIGGAAVAVTAVTAGVIVGTRASDSERQLPARTVMFTF